MAVLLRLHVGQGRGDAIQNALDVHVDHPVPVIDLKSLQGRDRHQAGIVEHHVDPPVRLHGTIHQPPDLGLIGDVRLTTA